MYASAYRKIHLSSYYLIINVIVCSFILDIVTRIRIHCVNDPD